MVLNNMLKEIPQQFRDKKNIRILLEAFAKQYDELYQVFSDLEDKTSFDSAKGKNLECIGDILSTSRKEVQKILKVATNEIVTDELYRKVLQCKALQNTCDCTYDDIMESIRLLWNTENITYSEDPERPATIFINLPEVELSGLDQEVGKVLAVRPAGVELVYTVGYYMGIDFSEKIDVSISEVDNK